MAKFILNGSRLALGGNVFGWTVDEKTSFRILDAFVDGGGCLIDTADVYSAWIPGNKGGESETIIGNWLKSTGKRNKVQIATKCGMLQIGDVKGLSPAHINAACTASLARLQTDYIDLYYAHEDDASVPQAQVAEAFAALIASGKIRALGASNFTAERLESALALGTDYTVLQPEYNLVSRGPMVAHLREKRGVLLEYEGALQSLCVARGIAVFPYFGLASGFLTGKYRSADDVTGSRAYRVKEYMTNTTLALLDRMDQVATQSGATLAQIALAWLNVQPGIAAPIASATSVTQLEELMAAAKLVLSAEQLVLLDL
jgi:aryl-alcohol dehydrogenase-like predicted oxidoreductase